MPGSRCVPFQLTANAWPLDDRLNQVNFARAYLSPEGAPRDAFVVRRLVVELCRYLEGQESKDDRTPAPVKLFLSHTKVDLTADPKVAQQFIQALTHDQPIEGWVDSGDIPGGSEFTREIAAGVAHTSLLVVLTDNYATREWCREEVLLAKRYPRPIAIVDALSHYEPRSFPYLGNVPRVRWNGDPQTGIDLLLKETLRNLHATHVLRRFRNRATRSFHAPRSWRRWLDGSGCAGAVSRSAGGSWGSEAAGQDWDQGGDPLERLAADRSLRGKRIALSMSESTDIEACGLDPLHLDACMLEVSRYLLIKGATLAYGGFLGPAGYTQRLFDLVLAHNSLEGVAPVERIVNYRGWPLPRLSIAKRAEVKKVALEQELPRPADLDEKLHSDFREAPEFFPAERSPEHRFAWARGMTEMRRFQADAAKSGVVARVVLGGTFGPTMKVAEDGTRSERWYAGRIPGVMEEVLLSVLAGQPVFLIGAFGGAARLVIDLAEGRARPEATWEYQKRAPFAPEMKELYLKRGLEWMDYPEIAALFREKGLGGIRPAPPSRGAPGAERERGSDADRRDSAARSERRLRKHRDHDQLVRKRHSYRRGSRLLRNRVDLTEIQAWNADHMQLVSQPKRNDFLRGNAVFDENDAPGSGGKLCVVAGIEDLRQGEHPIADLLGLAASSSANST